MSPILESITGSDSNNSTVAREKAGLHITFYGKESGQITERDLLKGTCGWPNELLVS